METMGTPESDHVFSGSVPEAYEERLVPLIFEPYAEDLVRRLADFRSGSILEVAAGTGVATRALAAALPGTVEITATDLNQAMIDRAMIVGTTRPVRWGQADVMSLPFEPESFDLVVCQFGVMFFDPKPGAFAEVHRILRPGGRFLFSVWDGLDDNEFPAVVSRAVGSVFPADPPQFIERTPHGYHDRDLIASDLRAGGFVAAPSFERVEFRRRAATPELVASAFCEGTPLRGEIEARGAGRLAETISVVVAALAQRFGTADLEGRISAQVVTAVK
jgi:SAM-dependent methyltransferase